MCGEHTYDKYVAPLDLSVQTLFREKYGQGEPTDSMTDSILDELRNKKFGRIIAIGGVKESDLSEFAKNVINTQQRLMRNNYVELTEEQVLDIYKASF